MDEMLHLDLLTSEQHVQIGVWIAQAGSPDELLKVPAPLWQAIERASEAMGTDQKSCALLHSMLPMLFSADLVVHCVHPID